MRKLSLRKIALTAMLAAISALLMMLEIPIPIVPSFIKLDFSDLPALIAAFAYGPVSGVVVCLLKNLIHLAFTQTAGVGELANFLLGAVFVLPAGLFYRKNKDRKHALIGTLFGALLMALAAFPVNYFITYPFYYTFIPESTIINMCQSILPFIRSIPQSLLIFNMPFTFVKGLLDCALAFLLYKRISPLLKGKKGVDKS